jgi:pimeloyl-ACP methyl ester carboxylesterase
MTVNGAGIVYEVAGSGQPIAYTTGGWGMRERDALVFAGRYSARYQTLIWDPRNCGFSDLQIEDAQSEWHLWTDDLHTLLNELHMTPAIIGGRSRGCVLSLLMGYRYPEDVKGLLLQEAPTNNVPDAMALIARHHYYKLADAAASQGMEAVIEASAEPSEWQWVSSWVDMSIKRNPENRNRVLRTDPSRFASIMRKWGAWVESDRFHLANLSDEQLSQVQAPCLVTPGLNPLHPRSTAQDQYERHPNARWNACFDDFTDQDVANLADAAGTTDLSSAQSLVLIGEAYDAFLAELES